MNDARSLIEKVGQFGLQSLFVLSRKTAKIIAKRANNLIGPALHFFQSSAQGFEFGLAFVRGVRPNGITATFQVVSGVTEVDNFNLFKISLSRWRQPQVQLGEVVPIVRRAISQFDHL